MTTEKTEKTEKKVKIKLPLLRNDRDNEGVYVAVNGKTYQIKRGVAVDVPACVAEVLEHSEEMQLQAIEYETAAKEKLNQ